MQEIYTPQPAWITVERPGYQGKRKDEDFARWNREFGEGSWRIAWELKNRQTLDYEGVFYKIYVPGYVKYFLNHPNEARFLADNYAYSYDKNFISREQAFDPYALYNKPGIVNQFHNVALNIALEWYIGIPFLGNRPIQVREGRKDTPKSEWPEGWYWSPGRISAVRPDLIPDDTRPENDEKIWWGKGTIEDLYQTAKVLQVKG